MKFRREENEKQEDSPDQGLVPAVKVVHRVVPAQTVQAAKGGPNRGKQSTMIND